MKRGIFFILSIIAIIFFESCDDITSDVTEDIDTLSEVTEVDTLNKFERILTSTEWECTEIILDNGQSFKAPFNITKLSDTTLATTDSIYLPFKYRWGFEYIYNKIRAKFDTVKTTEYYGVPNGDSEIYWVWNQTCFYDKEIDFSTGIWAFSFR